MYQLGVEGFDLLLKQLLLFSFLIKLMGSLLQSFNHIILVLLYLSLLLFQLDQFRLVDQYLILLLQLNTQTR
jgi:hypothetical protein